MENVFHKGELAVQQLADEHHIAQRVGRMIKNSIVSGAADFIEQQPLALVSSTNQAGQVWMSLLIGEKGFIQVPNNKQVIFNEELIRSPKTDLLYQNIQELPEVGVLFIESNTRRRYRVNGQIMRIGSKLQVDIEEAFGNCPKYIQRTDMVLLENEQNAQTTNFSGNDLGEAERNWIRQADTFYVATRSLSGRMDASHRGGNKGFIEILADGTLRIPDYPGNSLFNTLGNIYENPNTGLLFVDFEKGETLQLAGKGELHFEQNSTSDLQKTGNTGRFWLFKSEQWIRTKSQQLVDWEFLDYSPFNP